MFNFNNTHIFTGYLKQLLSSFNLPTCKVYTREFAKYFEEHLSEDPRIVESFNSFTKDILPINSISINTADYRLASRTNYLKNDKLCSLYFDSKTKTSSWKQNKSIFFDREKNIPGLTRTLHSPGNCYDTETHEYLGEFLRFLRDYYNLNLMSLYNCFTNKLYSNIYLRTSIKTTDTPNSKTIDISFDSNDPKYKIYALPVKLFENYTIAIECNQGIELFCGIYKTTLDTSERSKDLFKKTYQKINSTIFNQPFIYDKLNVEYWPAEDFETLLTKNSISRYDIVNREQDLKLFIKVPISCRSSIVILEGDYRNYNNFTYIPSKINTQLKDDIWEYKTNHSILNFEFKNNLDDTNIKLISKLQLLAFNTNESYPFSDRLVEYLSGSAITNVDGIADNIRRVQKVMNKNGYYFKTDGIWEDSIQKIAYDYMINTGPLKILSTPDNTSNKKVIKDLRLGIHPKIGHNSRSTLYDVLGYIDKDTEKFYASWKLSDDKIVAIENIQNTDIYNGLFDV